MITDRDLVWETLTPGQIDFCRSEGTKRTDNGRNRGNVNDLGPKDYPSDLLRDQNAVMVEGAFKLYCNRLSVVAAWDLGPETGKPDFVINKSLVDVKGIRLFKHRLLMQLGERGHDDWYYVSCCAELHPKYCLKGWQRGSVIRQLATIENLQGHLGREGPCYVLDDKHLLPMRELMFIIAGIFDDRA